MNQKLNIGRTGEKILREKSMETKICAYCGGEVVTYTCGETGWVTECRECGYLFDED